MEVLNFFCLNKSNLKMTGTCLKNQGNIFKTNAKNNNQINNKLEYLLVLRCLLKLELEVLNSPQRAI